MRLRVTPRRGDFAISLALLFFALLFTTSASAQTSTSDEESENGVHFSQQASATFNTRCSACHTYGKGVKVGPDLKGVNERRKHDWLVKFIHSSSTVIGSGDPTAKALFAQFKQQRMPDWTDLSPQQIDEILQFIAVGGPDIKPPDERNATSATPAEMESGRKLFYGESSLKYGAQACITCHSVAGTGLRGGGLGPDLSSAYLRYQDFALTLFLRQPCFVRGGASDHYLTAKESFAIKAFLRSASISAQRASAQQAKPNSASLALRKGKDQ